MKAFSASLVAIYRVREVNRYRQLALRRGLSTLPRCTLSTSPRPLIIRLPCLRPSLIRRVLLLPTGPRSARSALHPINQEMPTLRPPPPRREDPSFHPDNTDLLSAQLAAGDKRDICLS